MFLLAAITSTAFTGLLTCEQSEDLISKISLSIENRDEIIEIIESSSEECGEFLLDSKESIKFIDIKPN